MTQTGLINKIIKTMGMETCNPNKTPAMQVALASDPDNKPFDQAKWSYLSIVGMLLYVSNNTRPDITFAVSQVARFTSNPKESHASAIKTIVRYLADTCNKGVIVCPDGTFNLETYVDANFAGLWKHEPDVDPASA